jgi:hypothetical protein
VTDISGSIGDLATAVVKGLAGVNLVEDSGTTIWRRQDTPFAALDENALEVRLAPAVARAALRTPDTESSRRGPDWIRFSPVLLDQYARDRATAWIESAWRNAE